MGGASLVRWVGAAALLCALGACSSDGAPSDAPSPESAGQSEGSNDELAELQSDAASAAEQLATDAGLRVENETGEQISLTFPNGDIAWVEAGMFVVVLKPCRERLPIRAETEAGDLIAERTGPCRRRDTWTLR